MTPDSSLLPTEVDLKGSPSAIESFEIGSFNLVRTFVEHVMDKNASTVLESDGRSRLAIDWHALEALVAESRTLEQAIGRAIVIADQMSRCVFDGNHLHDAPSAQKAEDPFFSFSMADVVPDFGDESRYRSRVARRVARIFGTQRAVVAMAVVNPGGSPRSSALAGDSERSCRIG